MSEISKVEFSSSVWKKFRTKEITFEQARTLGLFELDFGKFTFAGINAAVLEQARNLIKKYSSEGLRTLDSIQLSTCILLKEDVPIFLTADLLLKNLLQAED